MSFNQILEKYRKISFSERDKGDRFERLMQAYLKTDPKYAYRFKHVWLWNEFPSKADLGLLDTGIDLVAQTHEGDYWAIQCKCYQETSTIDKASVDSFLSTSSREFKNDELKTVRFSQRLWISTTNKWGANATEALKNQNPPVSRLGLYDLNEAPVDWNKLDKGISGEVSRIASRELRQHQQDALNQTHEHFKQHDRGKLIMACGTGKTFNSLRIAEKETNNSGLVLFLVPSIALLGQTLREWTTYAQEPIHAICICSDPEISKKKSKNDDSDSFSVIDLALPASTNVNDILKQFNYIKNNKAKGMTVVFSTYQSIEVIAKAQKEIIKQHHGYGEFDLIICDEAHRTTGVSLAGEDESAFTKVHDNEFVKGKKRLYMTATPRLYSDDIKSKAAQAEAVLCSMDDPTLYGEEIYRIGFGDAVAKDLLTDYKVLILTLSDADVPPAIQQMIADKESEINTDDASKLIGCINALSKQILGDEGIIKDTDPNPMRRAVAFCANIATSRKITATFNTATDTYISSLPNEKKEQMVTVSSQHIDGTMSAPIRDELLGWLKAETEENECRVLTNVRCLSEGVDVPSLDAVLFLSARNSQVDVVQSVGRVMRKAPDKKYGYIIIPVVVPSTIDAASALDDNERYKVVWTVLNALRAHDDRFNATVNKIELNKRRPDNILIGRPEVTFDKDGMPSWVNEDRAAYATAKDISKQLALQFEQLQNVVFARMVQKVGDRRYWEQWAKSVAEIAQRQVDRITKLIDEDPKHQKAFDNFLKGLNKNINPSTTRDDAIEMLSQHIITKPVFDALFENYSFVQNNPMSQAMQKMLDLLEGQALEKDAAVLDKFYESVRMRAAGIDNAEGKQRIIIELYDKFFKTAFPKMVERLGIVYTPVEVVDFIIHSVADILKQEFNRDISDENVHILDPFTGTGTFITRLLQSGVINSRDLARKYNQEIHCNEIVLLAYYIAAINIENAYHDLLPETNTTYFPFDGICLTDTFQLGETPDGEKLFSEMFPQNSKRVQRQQKTPLRIIFGNPPYSIGQKSANDNAQNQAYPKLDQRIADTYAKLSQSKNLKALYDSYVKAFRWATDRLDRDNGGIIAFITNGIWLDNTSMDGFRKSIENEFSKIYIYNLKGGIKGKSGDFAKREGGNVFDIMTGISITFLIKQTEEKTNKSKIKYFEVENYLSKQVKKEDLRKYKSILSSDIQLNEIIPNINGDWNNQRNSIFETFIALINSKNNYFNISCYGLTTNRDVWTYNFSNSKLEENILTTLSYYQEHLSHKRDLEKLKDLTKISWSRGMRNNYEKSKLHNFNSHNIRNATYRPFTVQKVYFNRFLNEYVYKLPQFFPDHRTENKIICISTDVRSGFTVLVSDKIVDLGFASACQCFPLHYYEENTSAQTGLFDGDNNDKYIRRDAISDFILERAIKQYGKNVTKEDIFYYVYGFLHSPEYRETFANDLKKMLPRLPLVEDVRDFWAFSKTGRKLADLHLNYETVAPHPDVKVNGDDGHSYLVEKMRFPLKGRKDTIVYNSKIIVSDIPAKAYEYVVNGKSAIEWIMERYQITTHKESGITNNPNDWATEVNNPRYILDLLLSIINVSVQTVDLVNSLPKVKFE